MAIRKDNATKISHAELLYKEGRMGKEIAKIVGVTEVTITSWIKKYGWKEKRAATAVSRPQLVNKLLGVIDDLLEKVKDSDDPMVLAGLSDKLSKFAATIEKLDKKANVVDTLEVFTAFGKWLQFRMTIDQELSIDIVKAINKYQDIYIGEQIAAKM